jgi:hypothetical protein
VTSCEHCEQPVLARGWCSKHYSRWRVHGDPLAIKTLRGVPEEERFWRQVRKTDTCWLWTGPVVMTYGHLLLTGQVRVLAHRYSYELLVGSIPDGLELDHTCHDPKTCQPPCPHRLCVNPAHLEPVTRAENNRRSGGLGTVNAAKTHCPHGHPYDEVNTRYGKNKQGRLSRWCRTCQRLRGRTSRPARAGGTA